MLFESIGFLGTEGSRRPRASSPLEQELDGATRKNALKAVWSVATESTESSAIDQSISAPDCPLTLTTTRVR